MFVLLSYHGSTVFPSQIDPVVINFYESTIAYATVLNEIIAANGNPFNGKEVARRMRGLTFDSPISGPVRIDSVGDRQCDFLIKTMDIETGRFNVGSW